MRYLQEYRTFEKKKQKLKRLSEEEYEKEVEKIDRKQQTDNQPVDGVKTDENNQK